jgi:rod shape-determining protein MreD
VRRAAWIALAIVTALLLQSTVFGDVRLIGARPELLYLLTIVVAMVDGPSSGAAVGFAGGMAQDFLLNQPKGITALTLTLLGYAVGQLRQYIVTQSPWLPVFLVAGGTASGILFYGTVSFLLGQLDVSWAYLFRVAFLSAVYNGALTPLLYPLIKRVLGATGRGRVFRW